ncbi:MAG: geranylgeranylglycerol-phosphate geranylgeranyltransferase [Methanosarcinales archaeon]
MQSTYHISHTSYPLLNLMRPVNCTMAGFASLIGYFISYPLPLTTPLLVFFVVFLITCAGNAINDFFDAEIDAINMPNRPIPSGKISKKNAKYFSIALFVLGIALSYTISKIGFIIALFNSILLIYYSKKLKRTVLFGNIAIGYLVGSTFLFGGAVFGIEGIKVISVLFMLSMLATISREIIKDIEDLIGDRDLGAITLPVLYGNKKSAIIASIFGFIAVILSPLPYKDKELFSASYILLNLV